MENLIKKVTPIIVYAIVDAIGAGAYYLLEQKILPNLYFVTDLIPGMIFLFLAALASYFLTGKRAIKMLEWPMVGLIACFLMTIVQILTPNP